MCPREVELGSNDFSKSNHIFTLPSWARITRIRSDTAISACSLSLGKPRLRITGGNWPGEPITELLKTAITDGKKTAVSNATRAKKDFDSESKLGQRRRRWPSFDPESICRVIRIGTWMCNQHLSCRLCVTWRWQQDKLCPDVFSGSGLNPGPRGCYLRKIAHTKDLVSFQLQMA